MTNTIRTKYGAGFLDVDGDAIRISTENDPDAFSIRAGNTYREFTNDQAPAIALAILQSAGHVAFGNRPDSDQIQEAIDNAAGELLNAIRWAEKETTAAELTRRRDELAIELGATPLGYADTFDSTQRAIDMIIQLQDERPEPPKTAIEIRAALTADDLMDVPEGTLFISSAGIPLAITRSGLWRTVADLKQMAPVVNYLPGTLHINTTHEAAK